MELRSVKSLELRQVVFAYLCVLSAKRGVAERQDSRMIKAVNFPEVEMSIILQSLHNIVDKISLLNIEHVIDNNGYVRETFVKCSRSQQRRLLIHFERTIQNQNQNNNNIYILYDH